MSSIPEDLKYTNDHEWLRLEEMTATCGITNHAQEELTDIVFVELPENGREVAAGEQICVVESVKAVSDVFAPVSGVVTEVNGELEDSPELINSSPYEKGWLFKLEVKDQSEIDELLDADAYEDLVG
jgi:glycine cleavage system H protein